MNSRGKGRDGESHTGRRGGYSDEHWMAAALSLADEARAQDEVPIGALVVRDDELIGCGYNCCIGAQDPTAHAEIIAIRAAARALGNYRLVGCRLYVTVEPCAMCVAAIANARLEEVIYGCREPKTGCLVSHPAILADDGKAAGLNFRVSHRGGVMERECRQLMQEFFRGKREARSKR